MPAGRGPIPTHLELRAVSKRYGGARALESVSVGIRAGSVYAVVGENGAGKSTLGKVVGGLVAPDGGEVALWGTPVRFRSPREALDHGVATIAQELAIVRELTAAENVYLGVEPRSSMVVRRRELRRRYEDLCEAVGFGVPANAVAGRLRVADQQKLEVLRALARDAQLLVFDEPSAALSRDDVERLHEVIRSLRSRGRTVVLISHFLREVLEVADDVTVLRDGRLVRSGPSAEETEETLVQAMLGRSFDQSLLPKQRPEPGAPVLLSVRDLWAQGVNGVSLEVRGGEIVVLTGLVGAGRTEVAEAIVGLRRLARGSLVLCGRVVRRPTPRRMLHLGLAMVPESRKEQGLLLGRPVRENAVLSVLPELSRLSYVRRGMERRAVSEVLGRVDVRAAHPGAEADTLSGGNQQKLLFARVLLTKPRVLVADEPTRGVDVGARRAIYELLGRFAAEGRAVLMISSDAEEVLGVAHRVLVMRGGRIVAELDGETATEEELVAASLLVPTGPDGVPSAASAGNPGLVPQACQNDAEVAP